MVCIDIDEKEIEVLKCFCEFVVELDQFSCGVIYKIIVGVIINEIVFYCGNCVLVELDGVLCIILDICQVNGIIVFEIGCMY